VYVSGGNRTVATIAVIPPKRDYEPLQYFKAVKSYNTASSINTRKMNTRYMLVVSSSAIHTRQAV
jgi:hypothetical protein